MADLCYNVFMGDLVPHVVDTASQSMDVIDTPFLREFDHALSNELARLHQNPFVEEGMRKKVPYAPLALAPQLKTALLSYDLTQMSPDVKWLLDLIERPYLYQADLTDAPQFALLDIAKDGATFLASFRVKDYDRTGHESYTAVDLVMYLDQHGVIQTCPVVKKAIIAGGDSAPGGLARATKKRLANAEMLKEIGIPTIHFHGDEVDGAVVYEKLYLNDKASVLESMKRDPVLAEQYLPELIDIAHKLDSHGYGILGFISDLIHDPVTNTFVYLDTGSDLGQPGSVNDGSRPGLKELIRTFPQNADFITKLYEEKGAVSAEQARVNSTLKDTLHGGESIAAL
ncbi:MAG: hypothetical protein NTX63_03595 [Candidatus Peregrinibacteria bacterium]|nr:hypothetical protein [Candidatus Peregrinibacteria bacterium]